MALFTKLAAEIWRDYVTDGVPASGANKPSKSDIRAWSLVLEGLVGASPRIITAAGAFTVAANDAFILIDRTVSEAANINMGNVADKNGPVTIIDAAGIFASFNQSIVPAGAETVVGLTPYPLTLPFMRITLYPYVRTGTDIWLVS